MDVHLKANLFDIQTAISEIYSFFEQAPKRFDGGTIILIYIPNALFTSGTLSTSSQPKNWTMRSRPWTFTILV